MSSKRADRYITAIIEKLFDEITTDAETAVDIEFAHENAVLSEAEREVLKAGIAAGVALSWDRFAREGWIDAAKVTSDLIRKGL